jgi:cysteine desulfurase
VPVSPIYLDHQATTPCDPRVIAAMVPTFGEVFGNASSRHGFGRSARALVEQARGNVAALIGSDPREIVFTSGATESNNLAIRGLALGPLGRERGCHIVTTWIEHRAVLDTLETLEREGFRVTYLPVDAEGIVRLDDVETALTDDTVLITVHTANNEIGTLQPIAAIGALAKSRGIVFHTDAAQAGASLRLAVDELGVDLVSLSAHKMYGPKGVGALYVRRRGPRIRLRPIIEGGGHEHGVRSGTLNVGGIVGFGEAARIAREERESDATRLRSLRDRLLRALESSWPGLRVNGNLEDRLPGNLNVTLPGISASSVVDRLEDLAISAGSACSSPGADGSYVLKALGSNDAARLGGLRIGIGRFTTAADVDAAVDRIVWTARSVAAIGVESASTCDPSERGDVDPPPSWAAASRTENTVGRLDGCGSTDRDGSPRPAR